MRRLAWLALLLAGCTGGGDPPDFVAADLPQLVLLPEEAPVGTTLVDASSGAVSVNEIAEDATEAAALQAAGFVSGYITFFFNQDLRGEEELNPEASEAASFALLFGDADGAREGLEILEADVRNDGTGLDERPTSGFGEDAFAFYGVLDTGEPPGFLFAWRVANVVQVLVASGARDAIREDSARELAGVMRARAFAPRVTASPA